VPQTPKKKSTVIITDIEETVSEEETVTVQQQVRIATSAYRVPEVNNTIV